MQFLRRSLVGLFLIFLTVGLLVWAGSILFDAVQLRNEQSERVRPARERIFTANVVLAKEQTIAPVLTSFGEIRSRRTLELRTTIGGPLVMLADEFVEGGFVSGGQLIARIDPTNSETTVLLARNDLTEALAEQRDANRAFGLATDELVSAQDQVRLRNNALRRQSDLLARGVGTSAAVENANLALSSAQQAVLSRRQSLANTQARVDQAETTLERRRINLRDSERRLSETEIYAGFSGTLSDVSVVQGGLVVANERLADLIDASALEVAFRISTQQYSRLLDKKGDLLLSPIRVLLDVSGVNLSTQGTITRESATVGNGQTGRLLFAKLDSANGFRPGDFVRVEIKEPEIKNAILLPASAVDSTPSVLVVGTDDRLEIHPVELLRRQADSVIVRSQSLIGKEVVADRSPLLGAGIQVRAIKSVAAVSEAETNNLTDVELLEISEERRAILVAFVEGNDQMPQDAKERVLSQLKMKLVPVQVVIRIEKRMGG